MGQWPLRPHFFQFNGAGLRLEAPNGDWKPPVSISFTQYQRVSATLVLTVGNSDDVQFYLFQGCAIWPFTKLSTTNVLKF